MPRNVKNTRVMNIVMPVAAYDKLVKLAKENHRPLAEEVRMALGAHLQAAGIENGEITVGRGGKRQKPE